MSFPLIMQFPPPDPYLSNAKINRPKRLVCTGVSMQASVRNGIVSHSLFRALAFLRRYVPDGGRKLCMGCLINRPVFDLGSRRVFAKEVVALPVPRWSDGSGNKTTTAVRADVPQNVIDTRRAERAFIGANARFK
jgi:hypothetical protein